MTEKNRDILSNAIKNMGKRSPKASNWDDISGRLDQLDAGAFSQVKKDLPIHKAPANAWEKILSGLPPAHFSFLGSLTGKVISGLFVVTAITATLLLLPDRDDKEAENSVEVSNPVVLKAESEPLEENQFTLKSLSKTQPASGPENDASDTKHEGTVAMAKVQAPTNDVPNRYAEHPAAATGGAVNSSPAFIGSINPLPSRPFRFSSFNQQGLDHRNARKNKDNTPVYFDGSGNQMRYSAGAYYAFSLYQQTEQAGMKIPGKLSSYGIELKLEKHRWFFKTGIEYLSWEEKGTYNIDYSQNQLVYQFNYVDSAYVNTSTGDVTYFTSEREVFDSLPGQLADEAGYKYRMLDIPVLFGYRVIDRARFSLSAIGGIGFDIRLSGKQFIPVFNEENASITGITTSLQYRTSNNWRLIGGIELGYYLSRSLEIYLEPSYQQYMQPLYSNGDTKGPGSFKMKAGLRFSF